VRSGRRSKDTRLYSLTTGEEAVQQPEIEDYDGEELSVGSGIAPRRNVRMSPASPNATTHASKLIQIRGTFRTQVANELRTNGHANQQARDNRGSARSSRAEYNPTYAYARQVRLDSARRMMPSARAELPASPVPDCSAPRQAAARDGGHRYRTPSPPQTHNLRAARLDGTRKRRPASRMSAGARC